MVWFTYTEIKFIPDPIKDEAVNVGILVMDEKGNLAAKFIDNFDHISKMFSINDIDLLKKILPTFEKNKKNPKYLEILHQQSIKNHRIKVSSPRAINSRSIDSAADEVYSMMISIPNKNTHSDGHRRLVNSIDQMLKEKNLPKKYVKKQHVINCPTIKSKYDFVFQNGKITDILQVISFDIQDKEKSLFKSKSFAYDAYHINQFDEGIKCIAYVPRPRRTCIQYDQSFEVLSKSKYCKLADEDNIDEYLTRIVQSYN